MPLAAPSISGGIRYVRNPRVCRPEPDVEVIAMKGINDAYERMINGDVRYRFVIDLKTL